MTLLAAAPLSAQEAGGRHVKTDPDWLKRPTEQDIVGAWPARAYGVEGRAQLTCTVNVQGLAETCKIDSEKPPGLGFGGAALSLAPQFQFRPATLDGKPVPSEVTVPINFKAAPQGRADTYLQFSLMTAPIWAQAPLFGDLAAAYPRGAGGKVGYVAFRCVVKDDGTLHACDRIHENPPNYGFEAGARSLLKLFRMDLSAIERKPGRSLEVDVPIRLVDPASREFLNRSIGQPSWLTEVDPKTASLFPDQAVKAGLNTGRGVANCVVAPDGALTACSPGPADPPGLGFSEIAVRVAEVMRMNRWSGAGGPIDGARIMLPVRFNLAPGFSNSAEPKGKDAPDSAGSAKKGG